MTRRSVVAIIGIVALAASIVVATVIYVHSRSNTDTPTSSAKDMQGLLLDKTAIAAVMNGIDVDGTYRGEEITVPGPFNSTLPRECEYVDIVGNARAYAEIDWKGARGLGFTQVGDGSQSVYELIVAMPSADRARQFLDNSVNDWHECGGKTYASTNGGTSANWFVQAFWQNGDMIVATSKAPDSEWFCEHSLGTSSAYVTEVRVCGPVRGKAQAITEKILQNANS